MLTALISEAPPAPRAASPLAPALQGLLERHPDRRLDAAGARQLLQQALVAPADPPTRIVTAPVPPPGTSAQTQLIARPQPGMADPWLPPSAHQPSAARPRRSLRPAWLALLALALVGSATLVTNVVKDQQGATACLAGTPEETGVSAGFTRYTDRTGFSLVVPVGWKKVAGNREVHFSDPANTGQELTVWHRTDTTYDPYNDVKQQAQHAKANAGYRVNDLHPLRYRGCPGAFWDYVINGTVGPDSVATRSAPSRSVDGLQDRTGSA